MIDFCRQPQYHRYLVDSEVPPIPFLMLFVFLEKICRTNLPAVAVDSLVVIFVSADLKPIYKTASPGV